MRTRARLPAAAEEFPEPSHLYLWTLAGFTVFLALEQLLHWHHCRRADTDCRQPLGYLILIGDGLHNFLGGLGVAGVFLIDVRLGIAAWLAAAAHEVPQELGDFGVLIHGGWEKGSALLLNLASGSTFPWGTRRSSSRARCRVHITRSSPAPTRATVRHLRRQPDSKRLPTGIA